MTIEVIEPGPLTSVQTPLGRPDWRHVGVPVGGAADPWSARLANRLVGNADDHPLLEATLAGPTLRVDTPCTIAVTGAAWSVEIDGLPLAVNCSRVVRAGSVVRIGDGSGARAYLGVGGLEVPSVLGAASTDLRSAFGGHGGRALRAGDRLMVQGGTAVTQRWIGAASAPAHVRLLPGPHHDAVDTDALTAHPWDVSQSADRTGVRLEGGRVMAGTYEVPSMGLPLGAIQVPPDGAPIVMLADRPVTGGYVVPACVIRADIGRVAQLRPGDAISFAMVSEDEALDALRDAEAALDALEPLGIDSGDELGWAGSLD